MIDTSFSDRRQHALASFNILDTEAEAEFDEIVQAASAACSTPVSLISLLDIDRQWFKAAIGFGPRETPLASSICAYTAEQRDVFEIRDTTQDPRTSNNPLVTGAPHVRFYAGVPLVTAEGVSIGALCVLDIKPNRLTTSQALILRTLAHQAMTVLELRKALKERRESDRRNAAILESAIDYGIITMDLNGRVTSWNAGAEWILGWSEADMLGCHADVFFTEADDREQIAEKEMGAALLHGRGQDERWHLRKDGTTFWANGEMMPLNDENGKPEGFIKILRDRTEQRLAAERQRADADFMRSVLASSADCIKVLDLDTKLTFMSEGGMKVMEVGDFNEIKGCPWPDFWQGHGNADAKAAVWAALAGGVGHFQGAADTFKGTPKWWDVQVTPILNADGRPEKILSVSRDITEQKTVERLLAVSEERWRGLFAGMQEGFHSAELIRDADGRAVDYRFLEVNPAFAALTGLSADSAGRTIRELIPDIPQWLIDTYAHIVETGEPATFEIHVPELHRTFEVRARKQCDQQFAALFLEISERKRAEARRAAITELGDRLRDVGDKAEISRIAAEIMGRTLGLSHAGYGQVEPEAETILVAQEWTAPGLVSIAGHHQFRDYGSFIEDLKAGHDVVIGDTGDDPRTAADAEALAAISTRALLNLPVLEHGRFVALFYAVRAEPVAWSRDDIAFVRNIADRTRSAVARAEAEEQQRILNLELSHRLKNTFALVQSIASQTLRNADDLVEARDALAARLIALGKAHDILLTGSKDRAPITAIIDGALTLHQDAETRFQRSGPELPLGPSAALALGLILHELATNATKYGALSRPAGYVALDWTIQGEGTEAMLHLAWTEHGGPPVTPPSRKGFGSRLIQRGLAGGSVEIFYLVEGVVCTLASSLASLKAGT
ncbi:PAS domain-containing protein [Methylobacterium sp. J-001]|uniref:PAS domain-containing protein n=1 Tax=Methylobacterium sp. J-001 TaxID=2836609 RepID=UPI001FBA6267|nr:PAS domain-containing protein [Methylobacterium sp. J-001]MCJ2117251.1 PAS domain-containing protein [Methylobacterium sp. J-001]